MILFLDTETTGINKAIDRVVQIAWIVADYDGSIITKKSFIIKPDGFYIPRQSTAIHGITNEIAQKSGKSLENVFEQLTKDAEDSEMLVAHNASFDIGFLKGEFANLDLEYPFDSLKTICTMMASTNYCRFQKTNGMSGYKRPKLEELHFFLFKEYFNNAHDALADTEACMRCFYELADRGVVELNIEKSQQLYSSGHKGNDVEEINLKSEVDKLKKELKKYKADFERIQFLESSDGIFWLAKNSGDISWKISALKNPSCPQKIALDILDEALKSSEANNEKEFDPEFLCALVSSSLFSTEKINLIYDELNWTHCEKDFLAALSQNHNCDSQLIAKMSLYCEEDDNFLANIKKHPSFNTKIIEEFYEDQVTNRFDYLNRMTCEVVASSFLCSPRILNILSAHSHEFVREEVARNINCPIEVLKRLFNDEKLNVMEAALGNPNFSSDLIVNKKAKY